MKAICRTGPPFYKPTVRHCSCAFLWKPTAVSVTGAVKWQGWNDRNSFVTQFNSANTTSGPLVIVKWPFTFHANERANNDVICLRCECFYDLVAETLFATTPSPPGMCVRLIKNAEITKAHWTRPWMSTTGRCAPLIDRLRWTPGANICKSRGG